MSPPVVKNVSQANREKEGCTSFKRWFNKPSNIYISRNSAKYTQQDVQDSKWVNPFICTNRRLSGEKWVIEMLQKCYERYVRGNENLMNNLWELQGKSLGCWCEEDGRCHGSILVKLYEEKYGEESEKVEGKGNEKGKEKKKKSYDEVSEEDDSEEDSDEDEEVIEDRRERERKKRKYDEVDGKSGKEVKKDVKKKKKMHNIN